MATYYDIRMKKKFRLLRLVIAFIIGAFCVKDSFMPEFQTVNFVFFLLIMLFSSVIFFTIDSLMEKMLAYFGAKNANQQKGNKKEEDEYEDEEESEIRNKNKYALYSKMFRIPSMPKRILCIFLDFICEMLIILPCFFAILGILNILGYYLYAGEMLPWALIFKSEGNMIFQFVGCLIVLNECFDKISAVTIAFAHFMLKGFFKNNPR